MVPAKNILDRNRRDQRIESASGAQKQPVGRMLGPPQPLRFARNRPRRL